MPAVLMDRLHCLGCDKIGLLIRDQFGRCIECQGDEFRELSNADDEDDEDFELDDPARPIPF